MLIYKMEQNKQMIKEYDQKGHSLRSQRTFSTNRNRQRAGELTMLVYKREQNQQTIKEYDQRGQSLRSQPTFGAKRKGQEIR